VAAPATVAAPTMITAPTEAGAAPGADESASAAAVFDGGAPAAWLLDQITDAGGMPPAQSPEAVDLADRDGGPAPGPSGVPRE
jgi:hypothetical protein